jgi:hypothetical protein
MEPETNPTPGTPPQPETPNPEPPTETPDPEPEQPDTTPSPAISEPVQAAASTQPSEWPGAFGIFKRSAAAVKVNLGAILLFDILVLLTSAANRGKGGLLPFISFLVGVWVHLALTSLYLAGVRDQKQSFGEAAKIGLTRYVDGFIASLVTAVLLILSVIALIIPFFFVAPRLQLVLFYVIDKGMGPIEAIKASWADTKGYSLKVWGVIGVTILFAILCLVIVGIYLLFMYQAAFALIYLYVLGKKSSAPAAEAPAAVD